MRRSPGAACEWCARTEGQASSDPHMSSLIELVGDCALGRQAAWCAHELAYEIAITLLSGYAPGRGGWRK
jgi:hypothetical protein